MHHLNPDLHRKRSYHIKNHSKIPNCLPRACLNYSRMSLHFFLFLPFVLQPCSESSSLFLIKSQYCCCIYGMTPGKFQIIYSQDLLLFLQLVSISAIKRRKYQKHISLEIKLFWPIFNYCLYKVQFKGIERTYKSLTSF